MKKVSYLTLAATALLGLNAAQAADGKALYAACAACHQPTGAGLPGMFPPLAESEWVNGPEDNLVRIVLRGLQGPITVKGVDYPGTVPMAPLAHMSDADIAAVLTYIRSNFGNNAPAITAEKVKEFRGEVGQPMLTVADLIDPNKKEEEKQEEAGAPTSSNDAATPAAAEPKSGEVIKSEKLAGPNYKVWGGVAAWGALCILPVITGIGRKA